MGVAGCRCCASARDRGYNLDPPSGGGDDADLQAARKQDRHSTWRRARSEYGPLHGDASGSTGRRSTRGDVSPRERRPSGFLEVLGAQFSSTPNPEAWTPARSHSPTPAGDASKKALSYRDRRAAAAAARKEQLQTEDDDSTPKEEGPPGARRQRGQTTQRSSRRQTGGEGKTLKATRSADEDQTDPVKSTYRSRRQVQNTASGVEALEAGTGGSRSDRDRMPGGDDEQAPASPAPKIQSGYRNRRAARTDEPASPKELASSAANSEFEKDGADVTNSFASRRADRISKTRSELQ